MKASEPMAKETCNRQNVGVIVLKNVVCLQSRQNTFPILSKYNIPASEQFFSFQSIYCNWKIEGKEGVI